MSKMNTQNPLISVIVPVYNSEKYLEKCLDSLIFQTYENLEIICVNDGSYDNSPSILKDYAKKDSRIKILEQTNKGQSAARNAGLEAAQGAHISFVDSDDWVSLTLYKTFISTLKDGEPDIFIFNAESYSDTPETVHPLKFFDLTIWDKHESINTLHSFHDCNNPFFGNLSVCNKIYRKEFLIKNKIKFLEGVIFEDQLFHMETFLKSETIKVTDEGFYKYRNSNPKSTMKTLRENVFDIFTIIEKMDELIRGLDIYEEFKYALFQYKYEELTAKFLQTRFRLQPKFYQKMKNVLILAKDDTLDYNILKQLKNFDNYQKIINSECYEFFMKRGS